MAVVPPPALAAKLGSIERPERAGLRWTRSDQWHVTLRFLGAVDPDDLVGALARLVWAEPVVARAGPAPCALSRQVWTLPVAGLEGLAGAVASATASLQDPEDRPFRGHLTLARARHPSALRGLPGPPLAERWPVREVVAFRSELAAGGARHHILGRWPVGPG